MNATRNHSESSLEGFVAPVTSRVIASLADLALVVDKHGNLKGVAVGDGLDEHPGWQSLVGRRWADTLKRDSKKKVDKLLEDAFSGRTGRTREINQLVEGLGEIPFRFSGARLDDETIVALGRDIRPIAAMQQRLVSAQQAMDVEYRRLREAQTRYRVLFHVTAEAVLVVEGEARTVVEANPAAAMLLGRRGDAIVNKSLHALFEPSSRDKLAALVGAVEAGARSEVQVQPQGHDQTPLMASAAIFPQAGATMLLLRLWPAAAEGRVSKRGAMLLQALEAIPDGFVVVDEDHRILSANGAFLQLVQRTSEKHVVGQPVERWLGRPGIDLGIIDGNLREHGVLRDYATVVRSEFGAEQDALVTGVSVLDGEPPCFGFTVRQVTPTVEDPAMSAFLPRSVEKLRALVGRVSLKDIVQESADLIERLCIEAALDVSGNNRAAAAQLLGLSRQSLYSKLRRHGLSEFEPS